MEKEKRKIQSKLPFSPIVMHANPVDENPLLIQSKLPFSPIIMHANPVDENPPFIQTQLCLDNPFETIIVDDTRKKKKRKRKSKPRDKLWPLWVTQANSGKLLKLRQFKPIEPLERPLIIRRGAIRVLKIYNRFAKVKRSWPCREGYFRVNVCKNNRYGNELSPMTLGPVYDDAGQLYAYNIEDAWQCSKVWQYQVDADSTMSLWEEWSLRGRFSREAKRHRDKGKEGESNRNIPLYSLYMGKKMNYLEARSKMYMPWYEKLVKETNAYKDLKARHEMGENLLLLEYDGIESGSIYDKDLNETDLWHLFHDSSRPFGHGLVLACCLLDVPLWKSNNDF